MSGFTKTFQVVLPPNLAAETLPGQSLLAHLQWLHVPQISENASRRLAHVQPEVADLGGLKILTKSHQCLSAGCVQLSHCCK